MSTILNESKNGVALRLLSYSESMAWPDSRALFANSGASHGVE